MCGDNKMRYVPWLYARVRRCPVRMFYSIKYTFCIYLPVYYDNNNNKLAVERYDPVVH